MAPLLLFLVGVAGLVAGLLVLRSFGPRYRVGRLLATTPRVSIADARATAERGERRYLRVDGRIIASEEFEGPHHQPLVFRRTRLEARRGRAWKSFEDQREVVPFSVREGLDEIGVDGQVLADGLVVLPRESRGVASDLADRAPESLPGETPVRAWIEQVSSVEHAIVLGMPTMGPSGEPELTSGLGRPLVLTTLEVPESMRVLTGGDTTRPRLAAVLLAGGIGFLVLALAWAVVDLLL